MKHRACVLGLCLVALWFRWPAMSWLHVDEQAFIVHPLGFFSGDWNPHFFNYPTLPFYLAWILYIAYSFYLGLNSWDFLIYRYLVDGRDLVYLVRIFHALLSAGTVAIVAATAKRLYGPWAGGLAGLVLAIMPLAVRFSPLAIVDVPQTFFSALVIYEAIRLAQGGGKAWRAGLWVGLATACKYPAALMVLPVVIALGKDRYRDIGSLLLVALAAFSIASPYVWIDGAEALDALSRMGRDHLVSEGYGIIYLIQHHLRYGLGIPLTALVVVALAWPAWKRVEMPILVGLIVYALLVGLSGSSFMRYALPLTPLVALLVVRTVHGHRGFIGVLGVVVLVTGGSSLQQRAWRLGEDTRTQAAEWLNQQPHRRIAPIPKYGGQIFLLDPEQVTQRRRYFVRVFGWKRLVDAYSQLRYWPSLPPLYVRWNGHLAAQCRDREVPTDTLLLVRYTHPLLGGEKTDLPAGTEWLNAWEAGKTASGVYDAQDWYFQPLNSDAQVNSTGPNIEMGRLPVRVLNPVPTGREYFQLAHQLYSGKIACDEKRWEKALWAYKTVLHSRFNLTELFSVHDLCLFYLGLAVTYDQFGDRERAEWAREQAAQYQPHMDGL